MTYIDAINRAPLVLVEFYASWCPHCRQMALVVDQIKELLGEATPVIQLDIDRNRESADGAGVESIPTFIVYRNGDEVWRHSGEIDGNSLLAKVQSYLR